MADGTNMELMGMEQLIGEVEKLGQAGRQIEDKALKEAGEVVRAAIEQKVPRGKTGTLKDSIKASNVKTADEIKYVDVSPGKKAYYSKFVEFGTVKMKAKPFMAPGYETSKDEALATIERELKKGLGL